MILQKLKSLLKIERIPLAKNKKLVASLVLLSAIIFLPMAFGRDKSTETTNAPDIAIIQKSKEPSPDKTPAPKNDAKKPPIQEAKPSPSVTPKPSLPTKSFKTEAKNYSEPSQPSIQTSDQSMQNQNARNDNPQPLGILELINKARKENSLGTLAYNTSLNQAAKLKSQDMLDKNYFSHTSPDGKSDFDFLKLVGYEFKFAGSNIAMGSYSESSVFDAWINSSGHRANILNPNAREFGYGVAGKYFTMFVAAR